MEDARSLEETMRAEMSRCHGTVTSRVVSLERREMSKGLQN